MKALFDLLAAAGSGRTPMHMPGHKRNTALAAYLKSLGADRDITEIPGFDNLHAPRGILKEAMAKAAGVFQAEHTFFLVNGSTVGMLAAVRALTRPGDGILLARNSHLCAYNAVSLNGLDPEYIYPGLSQEWQITASLSPHAVEEAILKRPFARALVITSPTYEGVLSDLPGIIRLAQGHGIPVIVDEAHGAHLGLNPLFPDGAVKAGADIVIQSLHKTLPSLTQTALAHVRDASLAREMQRQLGVFETTSPSYLLMASIDGCVGLIRERGEELFAHWGEALAAFDRLAGGLKHLQVMGYGRHHGTLPQNIWGLDPGKLLISTLPSSMTGPGLARCLREEWRIEPEMALPQGVLAMTGMGDSVDTLSRLGKALREIDQRLGPREGKKAPRAMPTAQRAVPMHQAERAPFRLAAMETTSGCVCAEQLTVYPPGVPILVPGEVISPEAIDYLRAARADGAALLGTRSQDEGFTAILQDA
ncbi:MAG: aminotransferase class I/II-fold pyridoxal phosphate-dependent enzyme [Eubacteriales bacterium]|nr:aminotransferase class I/II-fold pyridoxal phosphate-dependent enzyme [Eubacteriales bacterium]